MMSRDDMDLVAKYDRLDAARDRLSAMRLIPFEYVKPDGKKKHRVIRFQRMFSLLDRLAYLWFCHQRRDFSDDELAGETQQSAETVRRATCDCVGRGLLKVAYAQEGSAAGQPPPGKRRYEIQWAEVDKANPEVDRDETGLQWLP